METDHILIAALVTSLCSAVTSLSYKEKFCSRDNLPRRIAALIQNPDNCPLYSSCSQHCGLVQTLQGDDDTMRCSCDSLCVTYGDCCDDFRLHCPSEHARALQTMAYYHHSPSGMVVACTEVVPFSDTIPLIAGCEKNNSVYSVNQDDPLDKIPVTDLETGVDFINARAAICNGVTNAEMWSTTLDCENENNFLYRNGTNGTDLKTSDVLWAIENNQCQLRVDWPEPRDNPLRKCSSDVIKACPSQCSNAELVSACQTGNQSIVYDNGYQNYANPYCALCASNSETQDALSCGHVKIPVVGRRIPNYSFSVLFTFDASSDNGVSLSGDNKRCAAGQVYVSDAIGCREVVIEPECRPGYVWNPPLCVPDVKPKENVNVILKIESRNTSLLKPAVDLYEDKVCPLLNRTIKETFDSVSATNCSINSIFSVYDVTIILQVDIIWNSEREPSTSSQSNSSAGHVVETTAENTTRVFQELLSSGLIWNITVNGHVTLRAPETTSLSCSVVPFTEHEYSIIDRTRVKILSSGQIINHTHFVIRERILYVCQDSLESSATTQVDPTSEEFILSILTIICMALSGLFLIARIVLQFIVPSFKTFPMQLQLYYCVALLASIVLFFLSPLFSANETLCSVIAALKHYAFLATFSWLSAIAADMYRMFSSFEAMQKTSERAGCRDMILHHLLAWGVPAGIVATAVVVDHTPPEKHLLKPDYGEVQCWLSPKQYAVLVFFAVPIFLAIILNIVLFILVSFKLRKAFQRRSHMTSESQSRWSIYLKLFILMGVNCVFLFLTAFIDHIVVWILVILTVASQGVYIGIVTVFNKQVVVYIRQKACPGSAKGKDSSEKSTKDTSFSSQSKLRSTEGSIREHSTALKQGLSFQEHATIERHTSHEQPSKLDDITLTTEVDGFLEQTPQLHASNQKLGVADNQPHRYKNGRSLMAQQLVANMTLKAPNNMVFETTM